jgi:hypothetical protein
MASDVKKSHIFQQLFSIKIITKLSYWIYNFFGAFLKYCLNAKKAVFAEVRQAAHIKYARKTKKFDREVLYLLHNRENPFFL